MRKKSITIPPNVLLIGRGTIAVNCINELKKRSNLPICIICDESDHGEDSWTKSLLKRSKDLGYVLNKNLFVQNKVNEILFVDKLKKKFDQFDHIFSVQPRAIFRDNFIALAKGNVYNMHFAPLPKLRGTHTSAWAILDGLSWMGVTIHLILRRGVDDGPIVAQGKFKITEADTSWSIFNKCVRSGTLLFRSNLKQLLAGTFKSREQNMEEVTYHGIKEFDATQLEVKILQDSVTASRFIRSRIFPPYQLPYFIYKGVKVKILEVKIKKGLSIHPQIKYTGCSFYLPMINGSVCVTKWKSENSKYRN